MNQSTSLKAAAHLSELAVSARKRHGMAGMPAWKDRTPDLFCLNQHFLAGKNGASRRQVIYPEELGKVHLMTFGNEVRRISLQDGIRLGFYVFENY
jgi:hypothetical protein